MRSRLSSSVLVRCVLVLCLLGAAGVLLRAASLTSRYDAEVQRMRGEWRTAQEAEGLPERTNRKGLYAKYSTPEIGLCKPVVLAPGGTATVTVPGKFHEKTAFLMENDQIELTGGTVTPTKYTATVKAAAGALPSFGRLYAYAPVSGAYNRCSAVMVGAAPTMTLTTKNGWTVTLTPQAKQFTVDDSEASMPYGVAYVKDGEAKPFETASGTLTLSASDRPTNIFTLQTQGGNLMVLANDMAVLQKQIGDVQAFMKKTQKEQDAILAKMTAISEKMQKEQESMVADPAALERKQEEFGCGPINLTLTSDGATGSIGCGRKLGSLQFTGTLK